MEAQAQKSESFNLPFLSQIIRAFYIYKEEGLKKALRLYPEAKVFIEHNAKKSFDEIRRFVIEKMLELDDPQSWRRVNIILMRSISHRIF